MTIGLLFWILMVLWIVLGFFGYNVPNESPYRYKVWGGFGLLLFVLLFLLGWAVFGFVLQGPETPMYRR